MGFLFGTTTLKLEELVESVVLECYNQYYRLAYSYVHNSDNAYDIVQNGVYKALRSAHTLRNPAFVKTWVYRIMLNEIFSYLRAEGREGCLDSYEQLQEVSGNEIESVRDVYENMDLQRALDALPAQEKAIVLLKYFEGFKLDEIAEMLDENVNTVKSKLYRSMKKLKIKLEE